MLNQIKTWLLDTKLERTEVYRIGTVFVMLSHENSEEALVRRAGIFRERFLEPWIVSGVHDRFSIRCIASIGMVRGRYIQDEMRAIIMRTLNMNEAGERPFAVYDEESDSHLKRMRYLRSKLIDSIYADMKGFSVNFHPIIDIKSNRWAGAEALCRWTMDGQNIAPSEFIPVVEQINLIAQLDNWVHKTAMKECHAHGFSTKDFFLDVNFSPSQVLDESVVQTIRETSLSTGFPLESLILEITESQRMRFDEQSFSAIEQLKEEGVRVSLDDFGTGFSSIENLIKLSAVVLKTDKILVDDIENDSSRVLLMQTLINLAHELGMKIVVEGVERQTQYEIIKKLGADYIQGYFFSKPLTMEQFSKEAWRFSDAPAQ
ncbi:MAG: EAL domain-containing protein [Raoultibacter sp.]